MTGKEMSEIFAMFALAYPNAEIFKGGDKLIPTIKLWAKTAYDVDFWTGQQAAARLMRRQKFPPTIAEFVEESNIVKMDVEQEIRGQWDRLRLGMKFYGREKGIENFCALPEGKEIIQKLGGTDNLYKTNESGTEVLNYGGFAKACKSLMQNERKLLGATK